MRASRVCTPAIGLTILEISPRRQPRAVLVGLRCLGHWQPLGRSLARTSSMGPDQNFALAKRRVATLLADVGESRFENVTDWLPRASVELKKSQIFDRPKARRSSADFDPR